MYSCTFKLFSITHSGESVELDCFDHPLFLAENDQLLVTLDTANYVFQLEASPIRWTWSKTASFPDLVLGILNASLKLGRVVPYQVQGRGVTYQIQGHTFISDLGLCPCRLTKLESLGAGQIIQLWSGELFCLDRNGSLRHLIDGWTPGRDRIPSQKSRYWEKS